jgi:hypothetical protein
VIDQIVGWKDSLRRQRDAVGDPNEPTAREAITLVAETIRQRDRQRAISGDFHVAPKSRRDRSGRLANVIRGRFHAIENENKLNGWVRKTVLAWQRLWQRINE